MFFFLCYAVGSNVLLSVEQAQEPGHVPLFYTIPVFTLGRAASLAILKLGSLCCGGKGKNLLYLLGLVSQWWDACAGELNFS